MPALHRSFNPYSSAPPPPASLPQYVIPPSTIQPLSNSQAGELIDAFLQTQGGKVLTLHRLADHLLGRTQVIDDSDIKELEDVLEEERRREGGVVHIQPDDTVVDVDNVEEETPEQVTRVPDIKTDKKRARKEERRMKKEKEREKRKREEGQLHDAENAEKETGKSAKKIKKDKAHRGKKP
jgi:hypothetical protein